MRFAVYNLKYKSVFLRYLMCFLQFFAKILFKNQNLFFRDVCMRFRFFCNLKVRMFLKVFLCVLERVVCVSLFIPLFLFQISAKKL